MVFGKDSGLRCKGHVDLRYSSPRNGALARFKSVKTQQAGLFVALESGIPRTMLRHASGSSNKFLPPRQFLQSR
eukprot:5782203-Pyramimonas_sp.AAC.1